MCVSAALLRSRPHLSEMYATCMGMPISMWLNLFNMPSFTMLRPIMLLQTAGAVVKPMKKVTVNAL